MGLLVFAYRKQDIIRRKSDLEYKVLQLSEKLRNLQSYASSIADGSVSMNDLMNSPASLFGRMTMFMMSSHQASVAGAQQKYGMMTAMPGAIPQMQNPQMQQQYSHMLFNNLYEQERERFAKIEEKVLNEQEKQITSEREKLQDQLKMMEKELESVSSAEDKAAASSAPKFGLNG